jgi:hypothetical protein
LEKDLLPVDTDSNVQSLIFVTFQVISTNDIQMNKYIQDYNDSLIFGDSEICSLLACEICSLMPDAENKIWHGHPVWFLDGNPIVGYSKLKTGVQLLFWSGQSFDESDLSSVGNYKAAGINFSTVDQVNIDDVRRWLKKSTLIQWDYKNIVKRKGLLERLK